MNKDSSKFKLGTADSILLAVGTLAIDYICSSKTEIFEVPPGGKVYHPYEALHEKIKQYGIKKGQFFPGSSLGNFINQVQQLTHSDPKHEPVYLATALATKDPSTKQLMHALDEQGIKYEVTPFDEENATNPTALLVESKGYTKILSFRDTRMPAIDVKSPQKGRVGVVIIGASAGSSVQTKKNALNYARKHNLPIGVLTTEGEVNQFRKDAQLHNIVREIMKEAFFFVANEDEARKILQIENPHIKLSRDKDKLVQQIREVFQNDKLVILLTFGSEGSLVAMGNTIVTVKVPNIPRNEIVSTAGAGDALAGAFVQGVRMKGMDVEGVTWSLRRANWVAQNVLKYSDTRTGQFTSERFLQEPPSVYEVEVTTL